MTDAQRIALNGALRLLIQKVEHACRARLDLERLHREQEQGALVYPGQIERQERALGHAEFVLDASIDQFVDVLEHTFSPEALHR